MPKNALIYPNQKIKSFIKFEDDFKNAFIQRIF